MQKIQEIQRQKCMCSKLLLKNCWKASLRKTIQISVVLQFNNF